MNIYVYSYIGNHVFDGLDGGALVRVADRLDRAGATGPRRRPIGRAVLLSGLFERFLFLFVLF